MRKKTFLKDDLYFDVAADITVLTVYIDAVLTVCIIATDIAVLTVYVLSLLTVVLTMYCSC